MERENRYIISSACAMVPMCGLQTSAVPDEIVLRSGVSRPGGLLPCLWELGPYKKASCNIWLAFPLTFHLLLCEATEGRPLSDQMPVS